MRGSATRRIARAALLFAAVWFVFVPRADAQLLAPPSGEAKPPPAIAPEPQPAPIPLPPSTTPAAVALPDIAARAEAAIQRLRAIEIETAPDARSKEIADALAKRNEDLDKGVAAVEEAIETRAGLDRLLDLERTLGAHREEIDGWQVATKARAEMLEARVAELTLLKETWDLTLESARNEKAPDAVLDRVRDVRKDVRAVQGKIHDERSAALTQQGDVARLWTTISLLLDNVSRARWEIRGRLFEADRGPLWTAARKAQSVDSVLKRVRDASKRDLDSLRSFAALSVDRIRLHGLLFAGFLALALVLRRWARQRRAAGKQIGPAPRVYESPISVALLGALLATPSLYPHAPLVLTGLTGLLILIPTLVLLFEVFAPELRRLWFAVAGFYLVDRLRYGFQSVELLERSLFLLEMLSATALVIWLMRSDRVEKLARVVGSSRWVGRVLRGMALTFAAAAAADAFGYFTLGKVLGEGLLTSVYVGVVLYGAVVIVGPIVPAVLGSEPLANLQVISRYRDAIETFLERAIDWTAIGLWAYVSLDRLTLADPILVLLRWLVSTPVQMGTVAISLGDVLAFGAVVGVAMLFSRALRVLLEEDVLPRTSLERGIPHAISNTAAYGVLFLGFLLALGAAGIDLSKVTVLAGAFGVGIGFGLQNIVNNFISGLILLYERPIQIGDTVEVGTLTGEVKRIGIRSSTLRTFQGAEVIVPNANLIAEQVVNWTLSDRQRRIELPVGVAYGTDPQRVLAILLDVAKASSDVLEDPPPLALFRGFGDSALNFELRVWTGLTTYLEVHSRIAIAVNAALLEAAIEIPFPQRDLHIK
jgi:small-conductance mechanosensitive channel